MGRQCRERLNICRQNRTFGLLPDSKRKLRLFRWLSGFKMSILRLGFYKDPLCESSPDH